MTDVVTLEGKPFVAEEMEKEPILRNPAKHLREIADNIESGKYGTVDTMCVCLLGNKYEIFGGGEKFDPGDVVMLLEAGIIRITREIERHGRE